VCYRDDQDQKKVQLNLFSFLYRPTTFPPTAATYHLTQARHCPGIASPPASTRIASKETIFVMNELSLFELGKSSAFGKECTVLSRIYLIIHDQKTLIRINKMFSIDGR
jgi:hypothetical protein